jgi:BolA protein
MPDIACRQNGHLAHTLWQTAIDLPDEIEEMSMNRQQRISELLSKTFQPLHLEVVDESHMHSGPDDAQSHFRVLLVSEQFAGTRPVQRQRSVNTLLADEFQAGLHALGLHTWTPQEWFDKGGSHPESPPCLGGSKAT